MRAGTEEKARHLNFLGNHWALCRIVVTGLRVHVRVTTPGPYHPAFSPLFCSSSHFCNGAKYSSIAPASVCFSPVIAFQRHGPGLTLSYFQHLVELVPSFL